MFKTRGVTTMIELDVFENAQQRVTVCLELEQKLLRDW
jgi:hypothetical protein